MKRFIISILCVSVFFVGLGTLAERAGAAFKSDERALELVRKARIAIGGDNAIAGIQSLRIVGTTTKSIRIDGADRVERGETEIALQLPDKLMKMTKLGHGDATAGGEKVFDKQVDVIVVGGAKDHMKVHVDGEAGAAKKITITKADGTTQELSGADADKFIAAEGGNGGQKVVIRTKDGGLVGEMKTVDDKKVFVHKAGTGEKTLFRTEGGDGKRVIFDKEISEKHHGATRQNELLRLTLGLLLTAPQGIDVNYTLGGESDVDGVSCNIVVAEFGGSSFKIFLGKSSNLPVMLSYTGHKMPQIIALKTEAPKAGEPTKDHVIFTRSPAAPGSESAEFNVRFSDYRLVGGVQLPFKWTQTVGGNADETFDVINYEVNPANIADKFRDQKVMLRTKTPGGQ